MKKLFLLICLLASAPCWATWTCVQGGPGCTSTTVRSCSGGTSCNITVGTTVAHDVEITCFMAATSTFTFTPSGDGTWVVPVASHGANAGAGSVECAYNLNATGGATTITCTFSTGASADQCLFMEFAPSGSSITFDVANNVNDTTSSTTPPGVALTLGTSNNYLLIQASSCGSTCSAINQSFNGVFLNGDGFAYKMNVTTVGTTPNWTQSASSTLAGGALAIYEVASGGAAVAPAVIY